MKSVDKFGRYRGFHGGVAPKGMGFGLDKHGNYDMRNRQVKRVGLPSDATDAITLEVLKPLFDKVNNNSKALENFPKRLPGFMNSFIEYHKNEKLVPLIDSEIKKSETKINETVNKLVDDKLEKKSKEISGLEAELSTIKKQARDELKEVTDMTRAFIYRVTGPDYRRNTEEQESTLRKSLEDPDSTWRALFPELKKDEAKKPPEEKGKEVPQKQDRGKKDQTKKEAPKKN